MGRDTLAFKEGEGMIFFRGEIHLNTLYTVIIFFNFLGGEHSRGHVPCPLLAKGLPGIPYFLHNRGVTNMAVGSLLFS